MDGRSWYDDASCVYWSGTELDRLVRICDRYIRDCHAVEHLGVLCRRGRTEDVQHQPACDNDRWILLSDCGRHSAFDRGPHRLRGRVRWGGEGGRGGAG